MQRRLWTQQLLALLALQACTSSGQRVAGLLSANYVPKSQPFTLGIASGSPTPESVILWTRIAPVELNLADTALHTIRLRWEVASDENFKQIKRSGELLSSSERAHCVHLKVQGLTPNTPYFYRFHCADFTSAVGRTRSAPRPQDLVQKLRIAYASCQHWEFGYFGAYQDLVASQPDLVIFLGDYIYEAGAYAGAGQRARRHPAGAARTLDQYRARYALYKSDESLQLAHACAPWLNIWDDHEVENDYAALTPRDRAPDFAERRIAAYRAFFEHMPVDFEALTTQARGLNSRIYTRLDWGPLARIHLLDTRQYRDVHACVPPGRGGAFAPASCAERFDPKRSLLGAEQEAWLKQSFNQSPAQWNFIAQQTLVTSLSPAANRSDSAIYAKENVWMDGWDGYLPAKQRLIESLATPHLRNPIVLGGDVHSQWVCQLRKDPLRPDSPIVATEFCGTSVTSSSGITQKMADRAMNENPDILFAATEKRGYNLLDLDTKGCTMQVRVCDDVKSASPAFSTLATFQVEAGRPGVQPIQ